MKQKSKIIEVAPKMDYEQIDTIVGADVTFVGEIVSGGSIRYEGNLKGSINISGNLVVGRNGLISGDITATNVQIIGAVEGNVCADQLRILSTGRLKGDAEIDKIIIDDGAVFIGGCRIKEMKSPASQEPSINDILNSIDE